MAERICTVDTCGRQLTGRGEGYGMCGMHYQRWRHSGNVHLGKRRVIGVEPCTIDGCSKLQKARGWCDKHWTRWSRYGDPEYRIKGEVRNGRKICSQCGIDRLLTYYSPTKTSECNFCMANRQARRRAVDPAPLVPRRPIVCVVCCNMFMGNGKNRACCSDDCRVVAKALQDQFFQKRRRAQVAVTTGPPFTRLDIFRRDKWTCGVCSRTINPTLRHPDPASASLDHVIPLCRGGEHSWGNVQASHLVCNLRKGVRLSEAVA